MFGNSKELTGRALLAIKAPGHDCIIVGRGMGKRVRSLLPLEYLVVEDDDLDPHRLRWCCWRDLEALGERITDYHLMRAFEDDGN